MILGPSSSCCISFLKASVAWPSDNNIDENPVEEKSSDSANRFILHDVNLEFPVGELSVISGKTGSGKSLLLAAIIGEVDLHGGSINAPSMAQGEQVAFVSQVPWLQNRSIKENILFGKSLDQDRYDEVLTACALRPDLAALAKGDNTEIGLRGVKLSGGQRARLAFARALYSTARLLIPDDIFAALDSHVAKEIFNALTGELAKGRIRVLVTHQISLCLKSAKYFVLLDNNKVMYAGNPDLMESLPVVEEIIQKETFMDDLKADAPPEPQPQLDMSKKGTSMVSNQTPKENSINKIAKSHNATFTMVYKKYFGVAGGRSFFFLFLFGLVIQHLLRALTSWLMGHINPERSQHKPPADSPNDTLPIVPATFNLRKYLFLYLTASLVRVIVKTLALSYNYSGSLRASKTLFHQMTFRVMRIPILWLDTTSIGEMLKRFTDDIRMVDNSVLDSIADFIGRFVKVLIVIFVGLVYQLRSEPHYFANSNSRLYTSKYTGYLAAILLTWCLQVAHSYVKGRTTVRSAATYPRSRVLEHYSSSAAGLITIRAFGAVDETIDEMHRQLDSLSLPQRYSWAFSRWLGLRTSLIGILFSVGTGMILLSPKSTIQTSLIGFCLTYSMGFSRAIYSVVSQYAMLEIFMDATGRVIEYSELETEDQGGNEVPKLWPTRGCIEVKHVDVAYSIHLPLVLRDVSFRVNAGKSIGIVGRTGAGKSSPTLALIRLLELRNGSILIDGIDISTIKLVDLRSRIAYIPQDPVLFSGTIRSNLDYFKQAPDDILEDALGRVHLLDKGVNENSNGSCLFNLDSPVSEGGLNMSQGQRQLLCLARVLIKKPMVMILDEATSAVDNETDKLIQDTIKAAFVGTTLIVVAHRLRTIVGFDEVMVMDDGKVVELGPPEKLLRDEGLFYKLVQDSDDKELLTKRILQ